MPAAASSATVTPKNLSGVIADKKLAIQLKKPICGLNSAALIAADATPMKMKVMINRGVRKLCIRISRFAGWARSPEHLDGCGAVDRFHSRSGVKRHNQTLCIAVGRQQVNATGFRQRVWNSNPLRLVCDMEGRRLVFAGPKTDGASCRIARRSDGDETHRKPAFAGIGSCVWNNRGVERRDRLRDILRRNHGDDGRIGGARGEKPAAESSQHDNSGQGNRQKCRSALAGTPGEGRVWTAADAVRPFIDVLPILHPYSISS